MDGFLRLLVNKNEKFSLGLGTSGQMLEKIVKHINTKLLTRGPQLSHQ
jgi:hypothetical protein